MERLENTGSAVIFKGDPRLKVTDMDKWIEMMLGGNMPHGTPRPYLYGSDAGFCARRNVLLEHSTVVDPYINSAGRGFMAMGVALENLIAESLLRNRRLLGQGLRVPAMSSLKVSGKLDLLILDSQDQLGILEIKSCGDLPPEPKPNHLAQIQMYSAITGIHNSYLVYISRKMVPHKPIPTISYNVDTGEEALLKVMTIACLSGLASAIHKLIPVPATFRKHTECHYCEFRDFYCHGSRPGLGGELPYDPLEELTPSQYIELEVKARNQSMVLLSESSTRKRLFIQEVLEFPSIEPWQGAILSSLI